MQGKLFQICTHLLYCSVLSQGGNVNTRRMSKADIGSIFHIKKSMKYSDHRMIVNYYVNYKNYQNLMLLTSSDTKRTLMHLFIYTTVFLSLPFTLELNLILSIYLEIAESIYVFSLITYLFLKFFISLFWIK